MTESRIVRYGAFTLCLLVDTAAGDAYALAGAILAVALTAVVGSSNPTVRS